MIEGLFLDRIDLQLSVWSVAKALKFAAFIDADKTEAGLARINVAMARAKIAVDAAIGFRFPPARFVKGLRFLEDIELRHESSPPSLIIRFLSRGFCEARFGARERSKLNAAAPE